MGCKHGVDTLCGECMSDAMLAQARAAGRAEGIREAIRIAMRIRGGLDRGPLISQLESLLTAPPPPAATCTGFSHPRLGYSCAQPDCPVHAPKPAAEKQ